MTLTLKKFGREPALRSATGGCRRIVAAPAIAAASLLAIAGCTTTQVMEPPPTTASDDAEYTTLYPYYAEICALSQLGKKPGFGVDLGSGGIGGHAVLYLNGVCRAQDVAYPILEMCDQTARPPTADGVGLSVNSHYKNATWVAIEGRDFFFRGGLAPGEALTRNTYATVQARATSKKIYDDVSFHDWVFENMPPDFVRSSFKYEISVATDYAIAFARNRYCARVPLSRPQMVKVVNFLNSQNQPYKDGKKNFEWNILTHNCSHINHNALAAADIWSEWEMDRFILISMFDFPVPKNEFVNLMRRTNDLPIDNLEAIFHDRSARALLLNEGRLPTQPGALVDLGAIVQPNEIYDTHSRIIFYDDPITGAFQRRFDAILTQPRYFRVRDNLAYFAALYNTIKIERLPFSKYLERHRGISMEETRDFRLFYERYYDYIDRQIRYVGEEIAELGRKVE